MKVTALFLALLLSSAAQATSATGVSTEKLQWRRWSPEIFVQARQQQRFVLLDLEAVWCHWCHVMDEITYGDPDVVRLLQSKYILVKVDQDSRPDLSNRYEDYGWPATIVFDAEGNEIVKRQGYIPPYPMASMLQAIIDDPTPGPSVVPQAQITFSSEPVLNADLRSKLRTAYFAQYDDKRGGWGFIQKYLDWQSVEYALEAATHGDKQAASMARQTLAAERKLIDPAWGGVYQYSVGGDWSEPHFEKIMQRQAEDIRVYAEAYALWHDAADQASAMKIYGYLKTFLTSPQGAFYVSQDADVIDGKESAPYFKLDDQGRRAQGLPRIDHHIYTRENGWAIAAIATLYSVTHDTSQLEAARRAVKWIEANRSLPRGGFRHGQHDLAGPYLGDTLAMARAYLALYSATGERAYLRKSEAAIGFIAANFSNKRGPGFVTAKVRIAGVDKADMERDENAMLARLANLIWHYSGEEGYRSISQRAMRYLATPQIALNFPVAAVLLADMECSTAPVHVTVVGHKDDASAQALFQAAGELHPLYKRVEWWDKREGKLPNPDVQYPELSKAAAFLCTESTCSSPIYAPDQIQSRLDRLLQNTTTAAAGYK